MNFINFCDLINKILHLSTNIKYNYCIAFFFSYYSFILLNFFSNIFNEIVTHNYNYYLIEF